MENYPSNTDVGTDRCFGVLTIGFVLFFGLVMCSTGCIGTPNCEPCENVCLPAPDCFGYYQTCWRPWPCPDRCPTFWEQGIPLESFPDPVVPAQEPMDIPVIEENSQYMPLPMHPHPLFLADEAGNVTMLPQPGHGQPSLPLPNVAQASWPVDERYFDDGNFDDGNFDEGSFDEGSFDEGNFVIPTVGEQTPFPSRAQDAFNYFQE